MGNLDIAIPEKYAGTETVRLAKGPDGPRDFVPGRGADYVPSKTGPGDVDFVDEQFKGETITFDNVNAEGKLALRNAAQAVVNDGKALTHRAVLEALHAN